MLPLYMILLSIFLISSYYLYKSYKKDVRRSEEYYDTYGTYPSYTSIWDTKYYYRDQED